jgi:hypothetical protein
MLSPAQQQYMVHKLKKNLMYYAVNSTGSECIANIKRIQLFSKQMLNG